MLPILFLSFWKYFDEWPYKKVKLVKIIRYASKHADFFSLQMPYKQEANKNPAEFTEN